MSDPTLLSSHYNIPEQDINSTPPKVLKLLLSVLEQHKELTEQYSSVLEDNTLLKKCVEALEARLNQNSSNSSRPPSSDSPYKKPDPESKPVEKKKKKAGAKVGHKGHRQKFFKPTERYDIQPEKCSCGCDHFKDIAPYYTHQELELPEIKMIVRHFVLFKGECSSCGKTGKGKIPKGHESGYAPRLSGFIGDMGGIEGNSRTSIQNICSSVFDTPISLGAIQNVIDRVSKAIEPHYDEISEIARDAEVNYVDETSWNLKGKLNWLWVMANPTVTLFMVHSNRSKKAFEELIAGWMGILVSDGYGVYRKWAGQRQTCLAHLIRRAKGLEERKDKELSKFGKWARKELQKLCHMAKVKPSQGEWLAFYARLSRLISLHRERTDEAGTLARCLEREMDHLFLFLKKEGVEPTNNFAERMIRFAVLWRRRSQGTNSEKGNRWVERILSLRQTCRTNGKSTYKVLVEAVECYFNNKMPDLSWIGNLPERSPP